jgi:hypothetical protein
MGRPLTNQLVATRGHAKRHVLIMRELIFKGIFSVIKGRHVSSLNLQRFALNIGRRSPWFNRA